MEDDLEYLENKWMNKSILILIFMRHRPLTFLIIFNFKTLFKILTNLSSCCSLGSQNYYQLFLQKYF